MRISQGQTAYLKGTQYSNGLDVAFEFDKQDFIYLTRFQILESICRGKNVVDIGFADHESNFIDKKIRKDKWLYKRLCRVAKRCHGVDIDCAAVEHIRALGYNDIECTDLVEQDSEVICSQQWDLFLISDVLEHMTDPIGFLSAVARKFKGITNEIVITVPNAFDLKNFKLAKRSREGINSDHRFLFTPYTLCKITLDAGLVVKELRTCRSGCIKPWTLIKNRYFSRHPLIRNCIVAKIGWE